MDARGMRIDIEKKCQIFAVTLGAWPASTTGLAVPKGGLRRMKIVETAEMAPTCHASYKLVETEEVAPTCHSFSVVETTEVAPTCH